MNIEKKPVENFSYGRTDRIKAVVIHIAEGTLEGMHSWFNNRTSQVSAHYGLGKDGRVWQFVEEFNTAWHAGAPARPMPDYVKYHGLAYPNAFTIGIENEGFTGEKFTPIMIANLQELLYQISKRYNLGLYVYGKNILEHATINTMSRAGCPGTGIHITNDLIDPVNARLQAEDINYQYEQQMKVDRPDVIASGMDLNTHLTKYGIYEAYYQLGELKRKDVIDLIAKGGSFKQWYALWGGKEFNALGLNFWYCTREQVIEAQKKLNK
jgi:N-acetyl-anhydromuramyl-L-alanine amidase AmpD